MPTLTDLIAQLAGSAVELLVVFLTRVALRDPLSFVAFAVGGALTIVPLVVLGALAAGAALDAVGVAAPSLGGTLSPGD